MLQYLRRYTIAYLVDMVSVIVVPCTVVKTLVGHLVLIDTKTIGRSNVRI